MMRCIIQHCVMRPVIRYIHYSLLCVVHLLKTYRLHDLLYDCGICRLSSCGVHKVNAAWNNRFREIVIYAGEKVLNRFWGDIPIAIPPIATDVTVVWFVRLSVRLSVCPSVTLISLIRLIDGMRCHLAATLVWSQVFDRRTDRRTDGRHTIAIPR